MRRMLIGVLACTLTTMPLKSLARDREQYQLSTTNVRAEAVECIPGEEFVDLIRHTPLVSDHGFSVAFFETYHEEHTFDEGGDNWAAGFAVVTRKGEPGNARVFRMWSQRDFYLSVNEGDSLRISIENHVATLSFRTWYSGCEGACPIETHNMAVDANGVITFDGEVVGRFDASEGASGDR